MMCRCGLWPVGFHLFEYSIADVVGEDAIDQRETTGGLARFIGSTLFELFASTGRISLLSGCTSS